MPDSLLKLIRHNCKKGRNVNCECRLGMVVKWTTCSFEPRESVELGASSSYFVNVAPQAIVAQEYEDVNDPDSYVYFVSIANSIFCFYSNTIMFSKVAWKIDNYEMDFINIDYRICWTA